jgi:hypothetical protein
MDSVVEGIMQPIAQLLEVREQQGNAAASAG